MKWIDKIKTMDSSQLARLLCEDMEHTCVCNVCWYNHHDCCCDLCEFGIRTFFDSEAEEKNDIR